jgi:hypothetical protein
VATISGVSRRSEYVHLRVESSERKRWQEAASASGRTLSAMIRDALEVELGDGVATKSVTGLPAWLPLQPQPARAKAPASLEERLAALTELVGL